MGLKYRLFFTLMNDAAKSNPPKLLYKELFTPVSCMTRSELRLALRHPVDTALETAYNFEVTHCVGTRTALAPSRLRVAKTRSEASQIFKTTAATMLAQHRTNPCWLTPHPSTQNPRVAETHRFEARAALAPSRFRVAKTRGDASRIFKPTAATAKRPQTKKSDP